VPVIVFVACAAACVVAHVAILLSTVRSRSAVDGPNVPRPRPLVEALWALVPMIALALVLTATWARVREQRAPAPEIMKVAQ
jgi:hypothetical protein